MGLAGLVVWGVLLWHGAARGLPFVAHKIQVDAAALGASTVPSMALERSTSADLAADLQTRQRLRDTIDDWSAFMQRSASRVWSLVGGVAEDNVALRRAHFDPAVLVAAEAAAEANRSAAAASDRRRADAPTQWLIINAPLAVWLVFAAAAMTLLCCCAKCFCACCC